MPLWREGSSPFTDIGFRPKQTIFFIMDFNLSSVIRTVVIGAAVAPLSFSAMGVMNATSRTLDNAAIATEPSEVDLTLEQVKGGLAKDCLNYLLSKNDSTLEREAKTALDKAFGGEVNYREVCNWVIN